MHSTSNLSPDLEVLLQVFTRVLGRPFRTQIKGGTEEPLYEPASSETNWACIHFTRDYISSALHEIAHWCVAGDERRKKVDYGYWYAPDGRSVVQQKVFEKVEVLPQALEWVFSVASGIQFRISADNLEAKLGASQEFKAAVWQQVQNFCLYGLPERARCFALALAEEFDCADPLLGHRYKLADI